MDMKRILLCGGMVMLLANAAMAEPAGMVMYFQSGDEVYLLLAEHAGSERGWGGFGGGARKGETIAETAAHKGSEESRGYFTAADLLHKIKDQAPVMDGDFASYFAEVAFVPAQRVMNHPHRRPTTPTWSVAPSPGSPIRPSRTFCRKISIARKST